MTFPHAGPDQVLALLAVSPPPKAYAEREQEARGTKQSALPPSGTNGSNGQPDEDREEAKAANPIDAVADLLDSVTLASHIHSLGFAFSSGVIPAHWPRRRCAVADGSKRCAT